MDAQGALDSLLGRLTTVLVSEAQLLGGVRGDVEFIKDEMESMNGLILHLTESQHRDHQVRAWMKQVVGLTRDCEGNVELYVHYVGSRPADDDRLLGFLRRIMRFLRTMPVRHRIATRIRELKVRARDVADRRQRYGVTVPASTTTADMDAVDVEHPEEEEDPRRRAVLLDGADESPADPEVVVRRGIETLIKCLSTEPATTENDVPQPQVKVLCIFGGQFADMVAEGVYQQHSPVSTLFSCKAWSNKWNVQTVLADILEQIAGVPLEPDQKDELTSLEGTDEDWEERVKRLVSKIQGHLQAKCFLIVLTAIYRLQWERILGALLQAADGSLPGSTIIMTTEVKELALSSSPYRIINAGTNFKSPREVRALYNDKARALGVHHDDIYHHVFQLHDICEQDIFALKTFLHLLYVNPNRTEEELQKYRNAISECRRLRRSIPKQVLLWCYNELPSKYRSCLLYLTVFPQGHVIRTTSLARRWVAEGLITVSTATSTTASDESRIRSSTDEAEHCLDVLFLRGFVSPVEISAAGNIKSCTVHNEVREFIARVATDVNFMDTNLPQHLAHHLSVHNRIGLQKYHSDGSTTKDIAAYLPFLSASPQWQLLKMLDLEGCKGLAKAKNLKCICKILLLKYLSLRNTDIAELPKQIKELQCLETLDIRQTKVQVFSKRTVVLPLLKHFLGGDKIFVSSNDARKYEESFSAVDMPLGIHRMNDLEILSHVQVTNSSSELTGIAGLLKLRKLGIALRGTSAKLGDLLRQIDKLHKCLRSLSVRIHQQDVGENHEALTLPDFITSLNISGLTSRLPHMIQELHQLVKLTLTETYMNEDGLRILGKLRGLRFLRLQNKAYTESELSLEEEEFQALNFLLVGTIDVTNINFSTGAAPKLERVIWSFPKTACVSGLRYLPELREFELNGDCNPDQVRDEIGRHFKLPVFKYNPNVQKKEDIAAASASSS